MQVRAVSRYARVAPNKARQVIAHIRGRQIDDARRLLELSPKAISGQVLKTLNSAVANAEHNNGMDADDLIVSQAVVDEGPTLKRYQPRAMGRAYQIRKRTSHITITVGAKPAERDRQAAPPSRTPAAANQGEE
ncbi:MAG TPA: 50S ribosomal protein L22 [Egibacteraceae bacterium]|nr:50S ribosomal protein L22 [Egibacteraceae bacterium]